MKTSLRMVTFVLALGLAAGCSVAATQATAARAESGAQALTVFVDATVGFRIDHMASQLTDSHAEQAARGYHYVDMEAYNENGDLQGFFVTYVRE